MTREEFIQILNDKGYSYEIVGDKIIVTEGNGYGNVDLHSLGTLPSGVKFNNEGSVFLKSLKTIHPGVEFNNGGIVYLDSLGTLPSGVEFNNGGSVYLQSLKTIHPGVKFNNKGIVNLNSIIGCLLNEWKGLIKGISSKRLLNGMIKREVFL